MVSYRSLFRVREYRYLYPSMLLSYLGDQLAAVAVAVLVFDRTGSGLLTALAYASAWLPGILAGPVLATYADRLPRRQVLVACDLVRAALIAILALPGMPVSLAIALLFATHLFSSPFTAARAAILPEVLAGDAYVTGNGLAHVTQQVSQIGGFAIGGVAVALVQPRGVLLIDAATFAASAVLLRLGLGRHPAPVVGSGQRRSLLRESREGLRYVFTDPWSRGCLVLVWVALGFAYAPEAILYPYARELGGGARAAGLMLAAAPVGHVLGAVVLTRFLSPATRDRLLVPMAVLGTAVLAPAVLGPPLLVVLILLGLAGLGTSFSVPLNAIFVQRIGAGYRARAMGVAVAGIMSAQGVGFLLAGALIEAGLPAALITGGFGLAGTAAVAAAAAAWRRGSDRRPAAATMNRD